MNNVIAQQMTRALSGSKATANFGPILGNHVTLSARFAAKTVIMTIGFEGPLAPEITLESGN